MTPPADPGDLHREMLEWRGVPAAAPRPGQTRRGWWLVLVPVVVAVAVAAWWVNRPHDPPGQRPVGQMVQLAAEFGCEPHWAWDGVLADGALIRSYTEPTVAHVPLAAAGTYSSSWWIAELCRT